MLSHNIGAGFLCECTDQQGALAILDTPGTRALAHSDRKMRQHLKSNIASWLSFANENVGITLKEEDIYFVRGWVKTTRWAVVAFSGNSRHAKLRFQGNLNLPVTAAFQLDVRAESAAQCTPRIGPDNRPRLDTSQLGRLPGPRYEEPQSRPSSSLQTTRGKKKRKHQAEDGEPRRSRDSGDVHGDAPQGATQGQPPYEADQCMFLHYFKIKRRYIIPWKIEAGAEPQDPSVDRDADAEMLVEEVPPRSKVSSRTALSDLPLTLWVL